MISLQHCSLNFRRPTTVCICSFLPEQPIALRQTKLHILQHPNEVNRPLHTVAILKAVLSADSCMVYKGRRFGPQACPPIHKVVQLEHTFLLYPGHNALNLNDVIKCQGDTVYNVVILDGTWKQAASIYKQNEFLHTLPKVSLKIAEEKLMTASRYELNWNLFVKTFNPWA